jgi:L-alanine-DL-glutamate epimerase-like enolase superfamily enzyme
MSVAAKQLSRAAPVERVDVAAFTVPTDEPESDGTMEWNSTTLVLVRIHAGGAEGIGYTYGSVATAHLIEGLLSDVVIGADAMMPGQVWRAMSASLRNAGRPGVGMMAISAIDIALWDLRARLLAVPVVRLLVGFHEAVPVYGSGGFCSYSLERLREQTGGWVADGIPRVKIKIGRDPDDDPARLDAVREAIGEEVELFADANGAYGPKQGLDWAFRLALQWRVCWFEEPVSSDDLDGLALVRSRGPGGLDVAAGEYGFVGRDFRDWLEHCCVDCMQVDVTRCGGITGLLEVAGLCDTWGIELSGHCAPALSAHAMCGVRRLRHTEFFHTHHRVERMLFEGVLEPVDGTLRPDLSQRGFGLTLRDQAARYLVYQSPKEGRR